MPRAQERGRSRTRRGKSRSWSPPNPRFSRDISPGSRHVIHYSGGGRAQRRNKARSPSPLTNATSFGDTAGESETEAGNFTSDDDSTRQERHTPKKDKSVWFKNRKYEGDHIAGKIEAAAVEHAKELNELAKRLSLCALVMPSSDDDSDDDQTDVQETTVSVKKQPKLTQRGRSRKKKSTRYSDDEDGGVYGSPRIDRRHGKSGKLQPPRGRSRTPRGRKQGRSQENYEGRQEHNQGRISRQLGVYGGRERNLDGYGRQSGVSRHHCTWEPREPRMSHLQGQANGIRRAIPSPGRFDENMRHCPADNTSTTGQSIHGRNLGRYGRRVTTVSRSDDPIVKQLRLPPGPLGINVISSARGPMVASVNDQARNRGIRKGDVLTEVDGRDITGMPDITEVISLFRNTKTKTRVVTIRRTRRSGVM